MKKTKILSVLTVLLAMGITACGGTKSSEAPQSSEQPVSSSEAPVSSSSQAPVEVPDPSGHKWGADTDVAADATAGTVAYKKATCTDNDGATRLKVNQSVVTYAEGSTRKDGTPDGYTKLTSNNQSFSFKFKTDKKYVGTLYLFGCMDGWGSSSNHSAGFYYRNSPNVEIKVNDQVVDLSGSKSGSYATWFGEDASEADSSLSKEGYAPVGRVELQEGVNEVVYKRVQTLNMLIKDFVFIAYDSEWGAAKDVAADATAGTVAYKLYSNNFDSSKKIEVQLADSMLAEGSANKNDPAGYMKLAKNDQSYGFKFNYDSIAYGELYQRGVMDGWSSNKGKNLFSGGSNGADDFEIKINNEAVVVYPEQKAKTFEQAMASEPAAAEGLSAISDVLTGAVVLKKGVNEFVYTRKASYNLALTHIVFVVENSDHAHAAATDAVWQKDANYHWHVCGQEGCNFIVDKAAHTWVADDSKTDVASTCTTHGKHYVKCSVCGQTSEEELPLAAHTWVAGTKTGKLTPCECSVCHAQGYQLDFADTNPAVSASKLKSDAKWDVTGLPAGKYAVTLYACAAATTLPQSILGSDGTGRYQFRFGTGDYVNPTAGTYADFGLGTGEKAANCVWSYPLCELTAAADVAQFEIHWTNLGYSCFIGGVCLVKLAA